MNEADLSRTAESIFTVAALIGGWVVVVGLVGLALELGQPVPAAALTAVFVGATIVARTRKPRRR